MPTSQKAWDGMFAAMATARKSIYLEMYIFLDDTQSTHDFLGLLEEKARAGLEVVIIADALGSAHLSKEAVADLRLAGVEFVYFSHWLKHIHSKILIIDGRTAFIGGVNIEEKIRHWRDLQLKLTGRIVKPLLHSFSHTYEKAGGRRPAVLKYSRRTLTKKIKAWVTDNLEGAAQKYYLNNYYRQKIKGAQRLIQIVTPYLLPPRWLLALLDDACRRGVKVEIIIPQDTDVKPLNKINYLNACRMSAFGADFYWLPAMNHAKIMVIDEEEGVVGSQNLDVFSFRFNLEAGVFFRQKDILADLIRVIAQWKREAAFFTAARTRIKPVDRLLIAVFKVFYPLF